MAARYCVIQGFTEEDMAGKEDGWMGSGRLTKVRKVAKHDEQLSADDLQCDMEVQIFLKLDYSLLKEAADRLIGQERRDQHQRDAITWDEWAWAEGEGGNEEQ